MQATAENGNQFASAEMLAGAKATFIDGLIEVVAEIEHFRVEKTLQGEDLPADRAVGPQQPAEERPALAIGAAFILGCLAPVLSQAVCVSFGATLKILALSAGLAPLLTLAR